MREILMLAMICIGLVNFVGCGNGYTSKIVYSGVDETRVGKKNVASSEMVSPYTFNEIVEDVNNTVFLNIKDIFKESNAKKYDVVVVDFSSSDGKYVGVIVFEKQDSKYHYEVVIQKEVLDVEVKEGYID